MATVSTFYSLYKLLPAAVGSFRSLSVNRYRPLSAAMALSVNRCRPMSAASALSLSTAVGRCRPPPAAATTLHYRWDLFKWIFLSNYDFNEESAFNLYKNARARTYVHTHIHATHVHAHAHSTSSSLLYSLVCVHERTPSLLRLHCFLFMWLDNALAHTGFRI